MVSSGIQEAQKDQRCVRNVKALIMISLKVKKTIQGYEYKIQVIYKNDN